MTIGKGELLSQVIDDLTRELDQNLVMCVVTTERGLIVAAGGDDQLSNNLAAMVSLMVDTSHRVAESLDLSTPRVTRIDTTDWTTMVYEFPVHGRPFRLGVVLGAWSAGRSRSRWRWSLRRRRGRRNVQEVLGKAADRIREILEG